MQYYEVDELKDLYQEAKTESYEWRRPYREYERLADNGLLDDLDEALPEVNDGTLAASLFKLPKRIVDGNLNGRFKALDADDVWITELANIYWENKIVPNANAQAPFIRKIKDVVRKSAIYGSQPVISLLMDKEGGVAADFIVPYVQDVRLEPGKVSDADSDVIFWDVYYTRKQVRDMIEQAKAENKENPLDGYNKWDVKTLQEIYDANLEEEREANEEHEDKSDKSVKRGGIKFYIAFQRGVKAPFYMCHPMYEKPVREWENPDPTGDIPVKYMYCYQDFNNPYGIGIVKLAGGTQNTLDVLRKYDILATVLGIRPPKLIRGNEDEVDEDSMVYAQDANWYIGNAEVTPFEMANGVYNQIPQRIQMYQTSLNRIIPMGDTTISGTNSGDPQQSKTPAGVKQQEASLSIDDEDFKDNLYEWYEQVAKNLINITFANMQGSDIMKLSDEERDLLAQSGLEFPVDMEGNPTNELEIIWDEARATFEFELDAEDSKAKDEEKRLEGLLRIMELRASDPTLEQTLMMSGYQLNMGELLSSVIGLTTDNDKILIEMSPEDQQMNQEQMMQEQMMMQQQEQQAQQAQQPQQGQGETTPEQAQVNMEAVMAELGVDQETAAEMLMMEEEGVPPEEIKAALQQFQADQQQGVPQ